MKVLYILMRADLSNMNAGRAMAQASHASNQFIYQFGKFDSVKEWQRETKNGFGTAVVLTASLDDINSVSRTHREHPDLLYGMVIDPEYGYRVPNDVAAFFDLKREVSPRIVDFNQTTIFVSQLTCSFVFGEKNECQKVIGNLKLHP
jgi:hypothetical protein